jgi:predicted nuclease of predicted toxin-antitoxin system
VSAIAVRELGLQSATDAQIFFAARQAGATIITKDQDFVRLLERHGAPPQIIWVTCLLAAGEPLVEISDAR